MISPDLSVFALAQQKLAAGLDHRDAVVGDDVGGGVGLAPQLREVGAGADDVDRCIGGGRHTAFRRAKARARDDLDLGKPGLVQCPAQQPDGGSRHPGADQVMQLLLGAVATNRVRRVMFDYLIGAGRVEALAVAAPRGIEAECEPTSCGEVGEAACDGERV